MKKNMMKSFLGTVIIILLICIVWITVFHKDAPAPISDKGINYIHKQENKKVKTIQTKLKNRELLEKQQLLQSSGVDVFSLLDDYVIYGDSRVLGFAVFSLLEPGRVFADGGNSFRNVTDWESDLRKYNPKNVIISYGINDLGLKLDDNTKGGYEALVKSKIKAILKVVPNAHIYVCGIIPVTDKAAESSPVWGRNESYNKKLKKACASFKQCTYIDTEVLGDHGNANIYTEAGVHFTRSFYDIWMQYILDHME